ncbi:hypothetical protein [Caulobacter sp. UNC279MFTsu5.1]|uniref:hypothetical protein n=1 Tax=Caulobacter sp. UNC279MFTsu5.1 TaxID=1502775 RepID=UPI0003810D57|nr:hypothetical protein [Caulobacter sp. UNC279MFTsu5.1]SFK71759.1 hypothetical protein SAMN02799626_04991 [Caulobacter sp. UNC279MFTsu5.1]
MYGENWGDVAGDTNADAIIRDRKDEVKALNWVGAIIFLGFIATCIWYANSPSPGLLAFLIFMAVMEVGVLIQYELWKSHTILLIAERRVQLVEQQLLHITQGISELRSDRSY